MPLSAQFPSTPADSLVIDLPLPDNLERLRDLYLHSALEKLLVFGLLAILLYLVARFTRRAIGEHIEDINRRHALRKWVTYAYATLMLLIVLALFADWLVGLGTILALLVAGVAVALQDVLKSIVGWLYLSSRRGIEVGSRIEVDGIVGDVIDVGVLKTTMLEVGGNLVYGRQSTGRLATVPNYRMLSESVLLAPASSPFVWHEFQVVVTFESAWERARSILTTIGEEIHRDVESEIEQGFRTLERRYAFKYGTLTPIVYVSIGASGVELTLRFLVHLRRRRAAVDLASRRILTALAAEPTVRIAYTTYRVFRPEAGAPQNMGPSPDPPGPFAPSPDEPERGS